MELHPQHRMLAMGNRHDQRTRVRRYRKYVGDLRSRERMVSSNPHGRWETLKNVAAIVLQLASLSVNDLAGSAHRTSKRFDKHLVTQTHT